MFKLLKRIVSGPLVNEIYEANPPVPVDVIDGKVITHTRYVRVSSNGHTYASDKDGGLTGNCFPLNVKVKGR